MSLFSSTLLRWLTAGLAIALLGCDPPPPTSGTHGWLGTIDTISGIPHVRNPDRGIWSEDEGWRIVEELRIGRMDGEGPDAFGQVVAIGVSPSGEILVVDGLSREIRVFDSEGRHERTVGRRGAGPGEFQNPYGLAWDARDRLWVTDYGNSRYVVFDEQHDPQLHLTRPFTGILLPWLGGFGDDGFLYDVGPQALPDGSTRFTYLRIDSAGQVTDSLPPIDREPGPNLVTPSLYAILPRSTFRFDPAGYLWLGETGEYRLIQRALGGDTVRIIEREYTPRTVTSQDREVILSEAAEMPPEVRSQLPEIPAVKAAFGRIHPGPGGFLFIQMIGGPEDQGSLFDVFDPEGRYLGPVVSEVEFVTNRALPIFLEDVVYGVTTDSLGVDYVVRARIERPE